MSVPGNPKPSLTWWRNDEIIDQTYEILDDKVKNILWVDRLQRKNADDLLSCKAENSKLTEPKTITVALNIYRKYALFLNSFLIIE